MRGWVGAVGELGEVGGEHFEKIPCHYYAWKGDGWWVVKVGWGGADGGREGGEEGGGRRRCSKTT